MDNCNFCKQEVESWKDQEHFQHLVVTKNMMDGHIHTHGELQDKELMKELIDVAESEIGIERNLGGTLTRKEIVFHNRQRIGDMLMFTCAIRDFKNAYPDVRVNVISIAGHIWDNNPYIDRSLVATEVNTVKIGPGKLTNMSNRRDWHFANAFRMSMEDNLKIKIEQGESRPDIWFTEEEYNAPRFIEDPYWVICITGEKGWGCKMYPFSKWQEFVNQNPDVKFVQIGAKEDNPPRLQGPNVIDHVGQTQSKESGIRDLFKLFLNSEGSVGLVSFHMHLSGALYKPCVVIAGGREPVSFTRYEGHRYLSDDGCLPCAVKACWHCDINACTNLIVEGEQKIPKCVDIIDSEDLTRALNLYYRGGRLTKGVPSPKPPRRSGNGLGINVVRTPEKVVIEEVKKEPVKTYGMEFGGGSLTDRDWEFIKTTIKENYIKTVLEFGAGLSTLLLNDLGVDVVTYETNPGWIAKIKAINPNAKVVLWDGTTKPWEDSTSGPLTWDLAFVDGPSGGVNREMSTKLASEHSKIVIVHDANREWEKRWQAWYIKTKFDGPGKGGHRCHLWKKKPLGTETVVESKIVSPQSLLTDRLASKTVTTPIPLTAKNPGQRSVKIISTARGWGGCARSVTTIMKLLLKAGHKVEFIPFRGEVGSTEYKEILKGELKNVRVTENWDSINEHCDALLMYADDYVWEFPKNECANLFSNLNATRKIMMLNFRRGKVGEVPWTKNWDKYMFLNSTQEKELLKVNPGVQTKVLPPCTDLEPFFKVKPNYNTNLRIVRHSSQGDIKFDKNNEPLTISNALASRTDVEISMLPGPSWLIPTDRVHKVPRTADPNVIAQFLETGNLFWYSLPNGYMDMGPRVILEAMAAGLPVLADNWGGAVDRVTEACGWLCNDKRIHLDVISQVNCIDLKAKGEASRQRAYENFRPEVWIEELVGGL